MSTEPDLSLPGKPLETWIDRPDGTPALYPAPQTKWDNCEHVMRELKGRHPTDSELAEWRLTRREYEHFLDRQPTALPQDDLDVGRDDQPSANNGSREANDADLH
jgi:hypothetical protein